MLRQEYFRRELEREWEVIECEEKKVAKEKEAIVAEWISIEATQQEFNKKRDAFEKRVRERFTFLPADQVVAFNVGGQLFKSTVKIWTRDRFSILAQLCTTKPKLPKLCPEDDAFFFDRDFWIFQFIYAFLKDNALPDAVDVLRELYCEASFYRIGLLRHAIESKMIGEEEAMSSAVRASRARAGGDGGAAAAPFSAVSVKPTLPASAGAASGGSGSLLKKAMAKEAAPGRATSSEQTGAHGKYSELPDPFGFTGKKKGG